MSFHSNKTSTNTLLILLLVERRKLPTTFDYWVSNNELSGWWRICIALVLISAMTKSVLIKKELFKPRKPIRLTVFLINFARFAA
jgi:hypothetical protein